MIVLFTLLESKTFSNVVPFCRVNIGGIRFSERKCYDTSWQTLYSIVGFVNLARRNSRWGPHSKSGATNFLGGKWVVWLRLKENSQYSLAVNKSPRFLFSYARSTILKEKIEDMGTALTFPIVFEISKQHLLLPTKFYSISILSLSMLITSFLNNLSV